MDVDAVDRKYRGANPDYIDLRDQIYAPSLGILPPSLWPDPRLLDPRRPGRLVVPLRAQADDDPTCVGQALASLIDIQRVLQGVGQGERVSAQMIYAMARYHELGEASLQPRDGVRRLRSAIKGFYHHGACLSEGGDGAWPDSNPISDGQEWPTAAQARAAEERALGAYFRLRPVLNDYHSAVAETRSVLVTAEIHRGWQQPRGGVIDMEAGAGKTLGTHAFLIVGYTEAGFLVLNSWGEDWGGFPIALGDGASRVPAPGIALWSYGDWARSVRDGWVLRLGVPGRDAFTVSFGEQGVPEDLFSPERRSPSTPFRELRGHFLHLEDGRCVEWGAYATPQKGLAALLDGIEAAISAADCAGALVRIPGILEPLDPAFARAVRQHKAMARQGIVDFHCFWCAEFAAEVNQILADIFRRCSARGGQDGEQLDLLFERTARGAGRAFWRDIERHARSAVLECDSRLGSYLDGGLCDERRGTFGKAFARISAACERAGKPLHIAADGAGALVLDALIESRCRGGKAADLADCFPALRSLALTLPALPMVRAHQTVLPFVERLGAGSALIVVPHPDLERRLTLHGYGKTVLHLVTRAFLDQKDAYPQWMLGMSEMAPVDSAGDPVPPFAYLTTNMQGRVDQTAPVLDLELERLVTAHVLGNQAAVPASRPAPTPTLQPSPGKPIRGRSAPAGPAPSCTRPTMDKIDTTELQRRIADGSLTGEEAARYLTVDTEASAPFTPVIRVNPDTVEMPEDEERSALAMNALNFTSRLARKAQFYRKLSQGYTGPRIAAEGDSWFQYPVLLEDVIDCLDDRFAVFCTSAAGDLLENMAQRRDYMHALRESGADLLLLSAGGNDLCAGGALATHLEQFRPGLRPGDYLRRSYQDLLDNAIAWYERICRDVRGTFPNVTILCHGYDYAIPSAGRWLGQPMQSRGITDPKLQRAIAAEMVDQFNRTLRRMTETMPHVVYVDCRGAVSAGGWNDELHPKNPGFRSVADRMAAAIDRLAGARDAFPAPLAAPAATRAEPRGWALHVGINSVDPQHYAGWSGELRGCENDAREMLAITESEGFRAKQLLTREATRDAVVAEIRRAAETLQAGDQFVFSISSHGSQIPDFNGDESIVEGKRNPDSTLCLYDAQMIDDELFDLWTRFKGGVRILMIADCCHSGSIAKVGAPAIMTATSVADLQAAALPPMVEFWPRTMPDAIAKEVIEQNEGLLRETAGQFRHINEQILMSPILTPLKASVIQISACQDEQVAYDGPANGVFTEALLRTWDRGAFRDDLYTLHRRIAEAVRARQLPRLFELPPVDHAFGHQRPFTMWGAGGRKVAQPAPQPAETAERMSIDELLVGEGDENDVPEPQLDGHRAPPAAPVDPGILARFSEFLRPEKLAFFDADEFLFLGNSHFAPGSRGFGLNSPPPEELWPNIRKTAKVLDGLRSRLGVPVRILSAYRNEPYNRAIGGERNSMHMRFLACDIAADGVAPGRVANILGQMRQEGLFAGGIGRYRTFTHVDTRGTNANWGNNGQSRGATAARQSAGRPEEIALRELAGVEFPLPGPAARPRGGTGRVDLAQANAAVNGASLVTFAPVMDADVRRAVLYSTQFAQRAADARVDAAGDRVAWWAVYTAALAAVGWVTRGTDFRRTQTSNLSASIDRLALDAIAGFVGAAKLKAIRSVLDALRNAGEGDARTTLLDLFGSEGRGGLFQLGAAEVSSTGEITLALGTVHFGNVDRRTRIIFFDFGDQTTDFWVAAAQMTLNLDFYRDVARRIVEEKLADAESLIATFAVDEAAVR